jgi:hypothetical protein
MEIASGPGKGTAVTARFPKERAAAGPIEQTDPAAI